MGLITDNAICKLTSEISNALNNKLLVGGIFYDLETAFDCVDHGILLSKLNFLESMARIKQFINLIWITGILEQQYTMTARTGIKFQRGPKLDKESHRALFWDLYFFLLHTNHLPKIINKTSAPIIIRFVIPVVFTINYIGVCILV